MLKINRQLLTVSILISLLTACAGVQIKPGADQIKLSGSPAPKDCQFLGQVKSRDINGVTQPYSSHEKLMNEEAKVLRNQAVDLGANFVSITKHVTTYTGDDNQRVNKHFMAGDAYRCPTSAIANLPLTDPNEFSAVQ